MKITDRTKKIKVESSSLKCGEVFRFEDCYYLATATITGEDHFIYNCVGLESGELYGFDGSEMVEVLNAEMIVK